MSLIIVDGPKGAGKSTLCRSLVERFTEANVPAIYHKHVRDAHGNETAAMQRLFNVAMSDQAIWVIDRFHLTEWVMGFATGRDTSFQLSNDTKRLGELFAIVNIPQIVLLPSVNVLQKRLSERHEADRRKVDMPWDLIHPLWRAATSLCPAVRLYSNEDVDALRAIAETIVYSQLRESRISSRY